LTIHARRRGGRFLAKVWIGSGTEIPFACGMSGSMRIAAFKPMSQECHQETFRTPVFQAMQAIGTWRRGRQCTKHHAEW
jgi:hypothetical protein